MDARDHDQLPLDLCGRALLDGPFTPAMARAAGLSRAVLVRMVEQGRVRRLLRGAYLAATVAETAEVRAGAVGLLVPTDAVVVDRTAAWVHGIALPGVDRSTLPPVEAVGRTTRGRGLGGRRVLASRDVSGVGGVRVTTPLRTAMDLGRLLAAEQGLGILDGLLRARLGTHRELLAELPRFGRHPGVVQLRHLVALADARANGPAESALRFHWFAARLPTPVPGLVVDRVGIRLSLGLPVQRFGVVVGASDPAAVQAAEALGWRVVPVGTERALRDAEAVVQHLEVEFHQHLLRAV